MSRNTSTIAEIGDAVTGGLTDAWAATSALAHDLATSAVDTAHDLGSAASSGVSDGAGRVGTLYESARRQVRPSRRRPSPLRYLVAAAVAAVVVGWWLRRRRGGADESTRQHLSPITEHTGAARAAVG